MNSIKNTIKEIIPKKAMYWYYLYSAKKAVSYDLKRRVRDKVYNNSYSDKIKRDLTLAYHIVEKGLTMPVPRPGFGKAVVIKLVNYVLKFKELNLSTDQLEFKQSVSVLKEYKDFHDSIGFQMDKDLTEKLGLIEKEFKSALGQRQIQISRLEYFNPINEPFDVFCNSRYSVRNYTSEKVPLSILYESIKLAQKSPSFCNRQPSRVYIVKSPQKKKAILDIQNGNRGFGDLAETLLVITSVISTTKDIHERNENHLNGGMFSMTLLNALHFKGIGACPLNWSVSNEKDEKLRGIIQMPDNEVALLIISCGYVPETFSIASSPRKSAKEVTYERL